MSDAIRKSNFRLRWDGTVSMGHIIMALSASFTAVIFTIRLQGSIDQEIALRRARDVDIAQSITSVQNQQASDMNIISTQLSRISTRLDSAISRLPPIGGNYPHTGQ